MEGLPFLPGNSFSDPTKQAHHRKQTLGYKNGYQLPKRDGQQISEQELNELSNFNPVLTYGQAKKAPPYDFVPSFVAFDKKVLRFKAYWKTTVVESPDEYYRVRPVDIFYYLEDDSISVIEPEVKNSGMPQGKLISRQRLPKNDQGDVWHWKDINMGLNLTFYGKVFHVTDCDQFTREFLESEGIVVNMPEEIPRDPYANKRERVEELKTFQTRSDYDRLRQFLEMDRKVLRFFAVWDDRQAMFGEQRPFIIHYYLADDTIEIREVHLANAGRDPFPVLIGRHKLPKDRYNVKPSHPSISMELSPLEIAGYFTPRDFQVGATVYIYGRKFLVYDCDEFTKAWYYQNFGVTDFNPINVKEERPPLPKMEIPPYNNIGSLEDTLQNCLHLIPEPAKKDFIKMIENDGKVLRYEALLDSVKSEDQGRRFILQYRLADDMISIYETPQRNSGWKAGKYLERSRIAKPGSSVDQPVFYGPQDLHIGAVVHVFGARFVITGCDEYVLKFMDENASQFPASTVESIRTRLAEGTSRPVHPKTEPPPIRRMEGDLDLLVNEIGMHLKKFSIIGRDRVDQLFLQLDRDRQGFIDREMLKEQLKRMYLPTDDDIVNRLTERCCGDPNGQITLEQFRKFMENP